MSVSADVKHHSITAYLYIVLSSYKLCESARVFGAGESFLEIVKSEAVVYALIKDTADVVISLKNKYFLSAVFGCGESGCKTCGASADDYYVIIFLVHYFTSLVSPVRM